MSENLSSKSGKAAAWSVITEIMAKLVSPIVNMVLARLLAPEAFGAVATITMIITFAEIFTDAGFQKYIIQHDFLSEEELDKNTNVAFWTNFTISAIIVILIVVFRNQLASLVGSPALGNGIAVASSMILMVSFSSIQIARFKRELDFKSLFFVRIGSSLLPLVVTVPAAFILRNFWALIIGTISVHLFNAVVLTIRSKWKPSLFYDFRLFKRMFSFSAWTLLESLLIWLTTNIDIFIVGNMLNDYYLGIYKTSMATVNSYMSIITASIMPVLFSTLSKVQNDEERYKATFYKFQTNTALVLLPMSVGIFLFRNFVTGILLGSQWTEAAGFVGLWGLTSGIVIVLSNYSSEAYRSKGNPKLSMLAQALHIAFLVPIVLTFIQYDFTILYTARALARFQIVLVNLIIMRVVYKFKFTKTLINIFPIIVSTLIMGVVGYFLEGFIEAVWWQILAVLICIVVYFASLLLLFPRVRKELLEIPKVKNILSRFRKKAAISDSAVFDNVNDTES